MFSIEEDWRYAALWINESERKRSRQRPTLAVPYKTTTIGAGGLNCRVRDGTGCFPSAIGPPGISQLPLLYDLPLIRAFGHSKVNRVDRTSARSIRTARLHALLRFHLRPIYLLFSQGPYFFPPEGGSNRRPYLGVGFTLRCLQRLSRPDLATQRCPWRDNWYTSGPAPSVLSY